MALDDVARQSVQARAEGEPGAPLTEWLPVLLSFGMPGDELPPWWSKSRDWALREFWKREGLWASAIYAMQAVTATSEWHIEGDENVVRRARTPLDNAEFGAGFRNTMKKLCEDWLTQDNGIFIEIIGPGNPTRPLATPPTSVAHLDAGLCWRSSDPEYPVWYWNTSENQYRKLHWTRIAVSAANPSPMEQARGIGFCATSRLAMLISMLRDTQRYKLEKISGRQTRAFLAASGVQKAQIEEAVEAANRLADNAGRIRFSGIPIVANPMGQTPVSLQLVEIAGLPDGFDWREEITIYAYTMALALGVDARELWPATAAGATKADAEVQHRKALRKGLGDFLNEIARIINQRILPEGVTFDFTPEDSEEDSIRAEIERMRADTALVMVETGAISPRGALAWLVDSGVLPSEYLDNAALGAPESMPESEEPEESELEETPITDDEAGDRTQESQGDVPRAEGEMEGSGVKGLLRRVGLLRRLAPKKKEVKAIGSFRSAIRAAIRGLWSGAMDYFMFFDTMLIATERHYREAWLAGAAQCGIQSIDELTQEEQLRLRSLIIFDQQYVGGLATAIEENSRARGGRLTPLLARGELWINRYNMVYNEGQAAACADRKLIWILGPTEQHCRSCAGFAGRVYRASVWQRNGALPQSQNLACNGFRCQCRLEPTSERGTPGPFPARLLG
jgi:hypothetical protein